MPAHALDSAVVGQTCARSDQCGARRSAWVESGHAQIGTARSPCRALPPTDREEGLRGVGILLDALQTALAAGGRVEIRGFGDSEIRRFGSFSVSRGPARSGRNPRTGAAASVPAKWRPHFKPDKALREGVERRVPTTRHQGCAGRHRGRPSSAFRGVRELRGIQGTPRPRPRDRLAAHRRRLRARMR